eukprot:366279-Chlamydomonas_euryale.AAC.9
MCPSSPPSSPLQPQPHMGSSDVPAFATFLAPAAAAAHGELEGPTCRRVTVVGLNGDVAEALSDVLLGMGAQSVGVQVWRVTGAGVGSEEGGAEKWKGTSGKGR